MSEIARKIDVKICLGTACYVLGAANYQDLEELIPQEWFDYFDISGAGCLDLCKRPDAGRAPYVLIDNRLYSEMTASKLIQLLKERLPDSDHSVSHQEIGNTNS